MHSSLPTKTHPLVPLPLACWVLCFTFFVHTLGAQIQTEEGLLYGNEWIDYEQEYFKIKVVEDGMYRLDARTMFEHGVPTDVTGAQIKLFWLGEEQFISASTTSTLTDGDYIEFYGQKNKSQFDRHLWQDPDNQMLNPDYSLHSDTSVYFLTWGSEASQRRLNVRTSVSSEVSLRNNYQQITRKDVHTHHFKPLINSQGVRFSTYIAAEGFATAQGISHKLVLEAEQALNASNARVQFRMSGNSRDHAVDVKWNGTSMLSLNFGGSELIDTAFLVTNSELKAKNDLVFTTSGGSDRIVVSTYSISYTRSLTGEGHHGGYLIFNDAQEGYAFLIPSLNASQYRILDSGRKEIVTAAFSEGFSRFDLPADGTTRDELFLFSEDEVKQISELEKVSWIDFSESSTEYLMITSKMLDPAGSDDIMDDYLAYRSSPAGGSFDSRIIYSQQLQDQFAYGIHQHPLSIKNFVNYIDGRWSNLRFVVLIGKGLEYQINRTKANAQDLMPVYGVPGSDVLMTSSGLESTVPLVPVGRIAVRNEEELEIYLGKVKVMEGQLKEATGDLKMDGWKKKVLHLSAGTGDNEQRILANSLQGMGEIITKNPFSANVISITKQSSGTFDESLTSQVLDIIKDGLIIKTYFGHGGITTTQYQSIEDPKFLENFERYPLMISLGCHTGNVFTATRSLSESNVMSINKGAIAYLGTSGLGFLSSLNSFGRNLYSRFEPVPSISLGELVRAGLIANTGTNIGTVTLSQQLTFHGDPALQLSYRTTPDYTIDRSAINIPSIVPITEVELNFQYTVFNLGINLSDTVLVKIDHIDPRGALFQSVVDTLFDVGYSKESLVALPVSHPSLEGLNLLKFTVDPFDQIEELPQAIGESNNTVVIGGREGVEFTIVTSSIEPCWPPEFGKVSKDDQLVAIGNHLEGDVTALLQIDTTPDFGSPLLLELEKNQKSGLFLYDLPPSLVENQVYFWRTRDAEQAGSWTASSFVVVSEGQGWHQSHHGQVIRNELFGMDTFAGQLAFDYAPWEVQVVNRLAPTSAPFAGLSVNNVLYGSSLFWRSINEGLVVFHHNLQDRNVKFNPPGGSHGSINTQGGPTSHFSFNTETSEDRQAFMNFIDNVIPNGHYVYVMPALRQARSTVHGNLWNSDSLTHEGKTIFSVLEGHGANQIRALETEDLPYLFAFIKGDRVLDEQLGERNDILSTIHSIPARMDAGSFRSQIIGPAQKWSTLDYAFDFTGDDMASLEIYGVPFESASIQDRVLLHRLTDMKQSIDISGEDISGYPFLQVDIHLEDTLEFTPPPLERLDASYIAPSDLAIDGSSGLVLSDSILAGQPIMISLPIRNLGGTPSDSTSVSFDVRDAANNFVSASAPLPPLEPGQVVIIEQSIPSDEIHLNGSISIRVNHPVRFREITTKNNTLTAPFNINTDITPPLLDVYFDQRKIVQYDLVPGNVEIALHLRDENKSAPLTDPELIDFFIIDPDQNVLRFDISDPNLNFVPSTQSTSGEAILQLRASFEKSGVYRLVASGEDQNGNTNGETQLEIYFEVDLEQALSSMVNYPNPFSTSTKFLYTLSGSESVSEYTIRIADPSGKIVTELDQTLLGSLEVGTHLTNGSWDGTDRFGDQLANGIYLYQVITNDLKHREGDTDIFVDKGWSKLAILR